MDLLPLIKMPYIIRQIGLFLNIIFFLYYIVEKYTPLNLIAFFDRLELRYAVLVFIVVGLLFLTSPEEVKKQRQKLDQK